MADTELTGVIHLTADTKEADKKVADIGNGDAAGAANAGASVGNNFSKGFVSSVKQQISNALGYIFASPAAGRGVGNANPFPFGGGGGPNTPGGAGGGGGGGGGGGQGGGGKGSIPGVLGIFRIELFRLIKDLANSFKELIESVYRFMRSLAEVSAPMAMAFGIFDMQIMMLKRQLGDALAPAMRELLHSLVNLAKDVLPTVIVAFRALLGAITWIINKVGAVGHFVSQVWKGGTNLIGLAIGRSDTNYKDAPFSGQPKASLDDHSKAAMARMFERNDRDADNLRKEWRGGGDRLASAMPYYAGGGGMA